MTLKDKITAAMDMHGEGWRLISQANDALAPLLDSQEMRDVVDGALTRLLERHDLTLKERLWQRGGGWEGENENLTCRVQLNERLTNRQLLDVSSDGRKLLEEVLGARHAASIFIHTYEWGEEE